MRKYSNLVLADLESIYTKVEFVFGLDQNGIPIWSRPIPDLPRFQFGLRHMHMFFTHLDIPIFIIISVLRALIDCKAIRDGHDPLLPIDVVNKDKKKNVF